MIYSAFGTMITSAVLMDEKSFCSRNNGYNDDNNDNDDGDTVAVARYYRRPKKREFLTLRAFS